MTATITDQRVELDNAETDDWTGTDGIDSSAPDPVEQSNSLGLVVSTETQEAYDTTTDDWSAGGTYSAWCRAYGAMDTLQNGGVQLVVGDGTDRDGWHVGGSDKTGFRHFDGPVEWANFVIDPANLPQYSTNFAGTLGAVTFSAVTQFGIAYKTLAKSVGGSRNCHVDICRWADIGVGITVRGGTTSGAAGNMAEAAAADRSTSSGAAHGAIHELAAGVYGIQANVKLGDSASANDQYWAEANATYAWEDRGLSIDNYYRFEIVGRTTQTVEYSFTSVIFTVPQAASASFDANDANLDVVTMAGCSLIGFDRGVESSQDTGDDWTLCIYIGNGTVIYNGCDMTGSNLSDHVVPIIDAQDETSYDNSPTTEGAFSGGTGYAIGDIIWLDDGSKITVDTLSGSAVLTFTVEAGYGGSVLAEPNVAIAQDRSDGAGTGFTLTPDVDNFGESAALEYDLASDPNGKLDDMSFTMGAVASHAIDFGINVDSSLSSITLTNIDFSGYGTTADAKDAIVRFLATTGSLTLNLIGCTVDGAAASLANFSVDDAAGMTVTVVIAPVTLTFTPLITGSEVRLYETGTSTQIDGVESSSTSFAGTADAGENLDYKIIKPGYRDITVKNVSFAASQNVQVNQQVDRNYIEDAA